METEVLVIGGGLAGMRAAQEASHAGARTVLVSCGGGASPYVHGLNIPVAEEDSVECFLEDTLKSGKYLNQRELARVMCGESIKLLDEFSFDAEEGRYVALKSLGAAYPRVVGIRGMTGAKLLGDIRQQKRFRILDGVRAMELAVEEQRVYGACCYDIGKKKWFFIAAKAVILACGGFGGIFGFSTNPKDIKGDGIAMAYLAGARLIDMEFIQFEPTAAVAPQPLLGKSLITTMLYEGAVMKNGLGQSFLPEGDPPDKDMLSRYIYRELQAGRGTKNRGVYFDATGVGEKALHSKYAGYARRYLSVGINLAREAVEVAPAPHTTLGGVWINGRCETNVEGLYACGEAAGGVHGANRLGGNAGLEILVFGKIAGRQAADYVKMRTWSAAERERIKKTDAAGDDMEVEAFDGENAAGSREKLEKLLAEGLNVERSGADMERALKCLGDLHRTWRRQEGFAAKRLFHDVLAAYLALSCALERRQSIGVHSRRDSEQEDPNYHIVVEMDPAREVPILIKRKINGQSGSE